MFGKSAKHIPDINLMLSFQDESEPEQFGVAMALDNTALQTAINEAIAQLTTEGFFDENVAYWFGK